MFQPFKVVQDFATIRRIMGMFGGGFLIILTLIKHGLGNIQYSSCLNGLVDMALSESRLSTKSG